MTPLAASAPPPRTHTIPMELDTKTRVFHLCVPASLTYSHSPLPNQRHQVVCLHLRPRPLARHPGMLLASLPIRNRLTAQTQAIDDVFRTTRNETDPVRVSEGKTIVATLSTLKYELQHDRKLMCVSAHQYSTTGQLTPFAYQPP